MHKGHKVEKKKSGFFFVLLPDFSYRPFQGELIPNESKPWNTVFCETQTLSQVCSCCQGRERRIILVILRCTYKGGYLFLVAIYYATLGQYKTIRGCFPPWPPWFKTLADRYCHCCYFDTGFVLQLVKLITLIPPLQPSEVPVILHRRRNKVLADIRASTPRVCSFVHFRLCPRQDMV